MLLRSVIQHVKDQNWTAIGIDFLIVVVGVFVGLQVNNWNNARLERQTEAHFLSLLRDDLRDDGIEMREEIGTLEEAQNYGLNVLARLSLDQPCSDDCWTVVVHAFHASQWFDLSVDRSTYDELRRAGMPRNDQLKDALATYFIRSERSDLTNEVPRYRELARSLIPAESQLHLWEDCYGFQGQVDVMIENCEPALTEEESRAVVGALRDHPETVPSLTYRISTISILVKALEVQMEENQVLIEMIDQTIGNE